MPLSHRSHELLLTRRQILHYGRSIDPMDDTVHRTLEFATASQRQLDEVVYFRMYSRGRLCQGVLTNKYPTSKRLDVFGAGVNFDERTWNGSYLLPATEGFLFPVVHNALPCLGHEQRKHGVEVLRVGGVRVVAGRLHRLQLLVGQRLGYLLLAEQVEWKSRTWSNTIANNQKKLWKVGWMNACFFIVDILENSR